MHQPQTKAAQIAAAVADRIRSGELPLGSSAPSERQLAEEHGVSRGTSRAALMMLAEDGVVMVAARSSYRVVRVPPSSEYEQVLQHLEGHGQRLAELERQVAELRQERGNGPHAKA